MVRVRTISSTGGMCHGRTQILSVYKEYEWKYYNDHDNIDIYTLEKLLLITSDL